MQPVEVGKSYDASDLAAICGQDEDLRYGYYAFVGSKATVIAQDEGNDVVKVVEIIRQASVCPYCGKEVHTIYTSRTVHLVHVNDEWKEEQADRYCTYQCPECYEELSPDDLDKLGIPNGIR